VATLSGGDKLEAYLKDLARKVSTPGTLRVGFLESARYPDGSPVANAAAIQNFGAPSRGIPPRPFFTHMIEKNRDGWGPTLAVQLEATGYDTQKALARLGEEMEGQLRTSINETNDPPLSPVTVMLRHMFGNHPEEIRGADVGEAARRVAAGKSNGGASTKPLIWTGVMFQSVGSEVSDT